MFVYIAMCMLKQPRSELTAVLDDNYTLATINKLDCERVGAFADDTSPWHTLSVVLMVSYVILDRI